MGAEPSRPVRIAIIDDHELIVAGVRAVLDQFASMFEVVEAKCDGVGVEPVDVALFDTSGSPEHSLERIRALTESPWISRVVLYTWDVDQPLTAAALAYPVHSVISKADTGLELADNLVRIARGERILAGWPREDDPLNVLSKREREVIDLLAAGLTNQRIGDELYLGINTVKSHVRAAYRKLGVRNRTEAGLLARGHDRTGHRERRQ